MRCTNSAFRSLMFKGPVNTKEPEFEFIIILSESTDDSMK